MAAGRGEFFRSFLEGLDRQPGRLAPGRRQPVRGRGKPGTGGGQAGPCQGPAGGKRKKRRPKVAPNPVSGMDHSFPEVKTEETREHFTKVKSSPPKENLVERLPSEILIKILSYLDASSLFCISHVSKLFHQLANDENLNVSWELTVCDCLGRESRLEQSRAYFFESSVIVRWSGGNFPRYHHISNIQLHGVRKDALKSPKVRKPDWRSLILKLDMKTHPARFIGKDRLIKLILLSPGFIIGIWRIRDGQVELKAINRTNLSQHRSLSGNIKLPWKSEVLEGSVENCCIMTLTLLDEFQKPFWCVSSPICIKMAKNPLSFDYSGEHFLMEYRNPDGQVKMKLVWLKEQKQFFLISLTIYVSVFKVNKHFSTEY
eukprot:superscaffoldBa00003302_g16600